MYFNLKIVVYDVNMDFYLNSYIVNSNYSKTIEIIKVEENYFCPVFTKERLNNLSFCKNILYEIVDKIKDTDQGFV